MKFRYYDFPAAPSPTLCPGIASRPIINAKLFYPPSGKELVLLCMLDTGADISMFTEEVGRNLGIDVRSGLECPFYSPGSGAYHKAFRHDLVIDIGGNAFETSAGFVPGANSVPFSILGQYGVFDSFKITFNIRKKELEMTPAVKMPMLAEIKKRFLPG